jgi:thioredoxin 1
MLVFDDTNFEEQVLQSEKPVLVNFWGTRCMHCRAFMPEYEKIGTQYADRISIGKIEIGANRRTAFDQKVLGLPTVILYYKGNKAHILSGSHVTKENVEAMLDIFINSEQ